MYLYKSIQDNAFRLYPAPLLILKPFTIDNRYDLICTEMESAVLDQ